MHALARLGRVPLLVLGIASLAAGIWGGLVRLPLSLPLPNFGANWITFHGPLMVCGFLGTLISLERAVGLGRWWTYVPPLLTGAGSVLLLGGVLGKPPLALVTAGSAVFFAVTLHVIRLQPVAFTAVMSAGALAWFIGNVLWWFQWPFNRIVPWWIAFLALTILGERLDLSRFQKPSVRSRPLLWATLALLAAGLLLSLRSQVGGERVLGLSLTAVAVWLARFDMARITVRRPGLPRFMAVCLLAGFAWLGVSGLLLVVSAPLTTGLRYDAVLHSFFVGFVFSMIFAHAPVIFPAVLMLQAVFRPRFYFPAALLQAGLLLRVAGDLANSAPSRQWGAILNAIAVVLFLVSTVYNMALERPELPGRSVPPHSA